MRNRRTQVNATTLRKQMTDAERRLWYYLRKRQLRGYKFRRQYPVGPFVADFACIEGGLIVEVDGGQHGERRAKDEERTRFLANRGFRVLRFWNDAVLKETEAVLEAIWQALRPHPDPPPQAGEGGWRLGPSLTGREVEDEDLPRKRGALRSLPRKRGRVVED